MPNAKFIIQDENSENKHICNICSDEIELNKIIGLSCNPNKHIFCYDCIKDWYNEIKTKKHHVYHSNYTIITMCPICRENGGLLPLSTDTTYIKGIHIVNYNNKAKKIVIEKNNSTVCGAKLCTKNGFCTTIGKAEYGGLCGRHKNSKKPNVELPNEPITVI